MEASDWSFLIRQPWQIYLETLFFYLATLRPFPWSTTQLDELELAINAWQAVVPHPVQVLPPLHDCLGVIPKRPDQDLTMNDRIRRTEEKRYFPMQVTHV